jgi:hypothetical protein
VSKSRPSTTGPRKLPAAKGRIYQPTSLFNAIKLCEDQSIGEKDRVIEERLRGHQGQADKRAQRVAIEQRVENFAERRVGARAQPDRVVFGDRRQINARLDEPLLDRRDHRLPLCLAPVDCEPARAFRNPHAHREYDEADQRAGQEGEPPSKFGVEERRVQQRHGDQRAERRAHPEAAVDHQVEVAAKAGGDQFLDRRIDGGVFPPDSGAGEEAEQEERESVPGEASERRRRQIDRDGDEKELLSPEPVGQPTEEQRAEHRAAQIGAARKADLWIGKPKRGTCFQGGADGSRQRHFEAIEDPGDAEGGDDEHVEPAPGQALEARRDPRGDNARRCAAA